MKTKDVTVTARDNGEEVPAKLMVCDCGSTLFFVYLVGDGKAQHEHIQCGWCGECFCHGCCDLVLTA